MTREERENALHCLKVMIDEEVCEECNLYGTTGTDHCEADCVRVAIKALEQPKTSDDCISRKVLIEKLHSRFADGFDADKWWNSTSVLCAVYGAPSVTPLTTPLTASLSIEQIIKDTIKEYIGKSCDDVTELLLALNKDLCERIRKENMNGL